MSTEISEYDVITGETPAYGFKNQGRNRKYPFAKMDVGDCFDVEVPADIKRVESVRTPILNAARNYRMFSGDADFKVTTCMRSKPGFVRVFRVG